MLAANPKFSAVKNWKARWSLTGTSRPRSGTMFLWRFLPNAPPPPLGNPKPHLWTKHLIIFNPPTSGSGTLSLSIIYYLFYFIIFFFFFYRWKGMGTLKHPFSFQLRSGGLIEALRVLKLGYPTRVPYQVEKKVTKHDSTRKPNTSLQLQI